MTKTLEFLYDAERANHTDEKGRTLAEVLEEHPEYEIAEPPHYGKLQPQADGGALFERETVVVTTDNKEEEGQGYNYSYNEDTEEWECGDCDFTTEHTEGAIKGHWTRKHGEEEEE